MVLEVVLVLDWGRRLSWGGVEGRADVGGRLVLEVGLELRLCLCQCWGAMMEEFCVGMGVALERS